MSPDIRTSVVDENPSPKTVYVDGNPSTKTIAPSADYDLLLQIERGENQTFQHKVQHGLRRFSTYYIRHSPGFLGIVSRHSKEIVGAFKVSGQDYGEFIDNVLEKNPAVDVGEKEGLYKVFSDFFACEDDKEMQSLYGGKYGYYHFEDMGGALRYIGWED